MDYIIDKDLRYEDTIRSELQAYNRPLTGPRKIDQYNIYIIDNNDNLIGAAITEMRWDWVNFVTLFYEDLDSAKQITQLVAKHYQPIARGIKMKTSSFSLVQDLEACGYTLSASLTYTPEGSNVFILSHGLQLLDSSNVYQSITSRHLIETYKTSIQKGLERFMTYHLIPSRTNKTSIVCLDGNTFVGGIVGYMEGLMFHTQLLFVKEEFRSNRIGTELIQRLEDYAIQSGATHASVSTTSFQAYDFYIKQGYHHDLTIYDKPVGFQEYTFSKRL